MRFCFYAINGIGLGHLARTIAIARALGNDDHQHLFLTSSPAIQMLEDESLPYIQFPSDQLLADKTIALKDKTFSRLLHGAVSAAINAFDPHVFVVDTVPTGCRSELAQLAFCARRSVFILREQKKALDDTTLSAINRYNHVLIPHPEGKLPPGIPAGTASFTGPILLRSRHDPPGDPLAIEIEPGQLSVLVAFGGGGDRDFARLVEWLETAATRHPEIHFSISIPPLLRGGLPARPAKNVTRFEKSPLADLWQSFDFVISAAGYNSTNELIHFGVPTIFVPLERPLDDQHARARDLVEKGAALDAVPFDDAGLDAAIQRLRDASQRETMSAVSSNLIPTNGAELAARILIDVTN